MAPTPNRPFFANFFAAFRTHAAFQKAAPAALTASSSASQQTASQHNTPRPRSRSTSPAPAPTPSQARPIATKSSPQTTSSTAAAVAAHALQAARSPPPNTYRAPSTSPPPSPGPSYTPPRSPHPRNSNGGFQKGRTPSQTRCAGPRSSIDSDSSGNPWRDAFSGGQNWYIGGRTANGEERFYKLGMVRRYTSADRLSLDRLSL